MSMFYGVVQEGFMDVHHWCIYINNVFSIICKLNRACRSSTSAMFANNHVIFFLEINRKMVLNFLEEFSSLIMRYYLTFSLIMRYYTTFSLIMRYCKLDFQSDNAILLDFYLLFVLFLFFAIFNYYLIYVFVMFCTHP